jgi:hypothetical protein
MIRRTYHLTAQQVKALVSLARKTGLSVAELIRRAVDLLLEKEGK